MGGYTGTDSDFGGNFRGVVNLPVGETTALRVVGYYNEMAGFIDSVYPGRSVREDVNSGEKYGARISMLFQPSDTLSITPRIVYQQLETDGYPRIDRLQHPRQPVHDDAAGGQSRRARPGHADPRRHRR